MKLVEVKELLAEANVINAQWIAPLLVSIIRNNCEAATNRLPRGRGAQATIEKWVTTVLTNYIKRTDPDNDPSGFVNDLVFALPADDPRVAEIVDGGDIFFRNMRTDSINDYGLPDITGDFKWVDGKSNLYLLDPDLVQYPDVRTRLNHWIDFLASHPNYLESLDRVSVPTMVQLVAQWDDALSKKKIEDDATKLKEGEVLMKSYDSGHAWVKLVSHESLSWEGQQMGHCVGSYGVHVQNGYCVIMSLRDPKGEPHVTVELRQGGGDEWMMIQCKGKSNRPPVARYMEFVYDLAVGGVKPFAFNPARINRDQHDVKFFIEDGPKGPRIVTPEKLAKHMYTVLMGAEPTTIDVGHLRFITTPKAHDDRDIYNTFVGRGSYKEMFTELDYGRPNIARGRVAPKGVYVYAGKKAQNYLPAAVIIMEGSSIAAVHYDAAQIELTERHLSVFAQWYHEYSKNIGLAVPMYDASIFERALLNNYGLAREKDELVKFEDLSQTAIKLYTRHYFDKAFGDTVSLMNVRRDKDGDEWMAEAITRGVERWFEKNLKHKVTFGGHSDDIIYDAELGAAFWVKRDYDAIDDDAIKAIIEVRAASEKEMGAAAAYFFNAVKMGTKKFTLKDRKAMNVTFDKNDGEWVPL